MYRGGGGQFSTRQEEEDDRALQIENPERMVGSGYMSFPPQRPFEQPLVMQTSQGFVDYSYGKTDRHVAMPQTLRPSANVPQERKPAPVSREISSQQGPAVPYANNNFLNSLHRSQQSMPDSVDQSNSQYTMIQQQIPGFDLQGQHGGLAGNSYSQYTGVSTMDPNSIATTTASNSVGLTSFMQPSTFPSYPPQGSQASVPGISQKHVPSSMRHDNTLRQVNGDSGAFQGLSAPSLSGSSVGSTNFAGAAAFRQQQQPPKESAYPPPPAQPLVPPRQRPLVQSLGATTAQANINSPAQYPAAGVPYKNYIPNGNPHTAYGSTHHVQHQRPPPLPSQPPPASATASINRYAPHTRPPLQHDRQQAKAPGAPAHIASNSGRPLSRPAGPVVAVSQKKQPVQATVPPKAKTPLEEVIEELEKMGFSSAKATRAAHSCGRADLQLAVNWIMEHEGDPDIDDPWVPEDHKKTGGMQNGVDDAQGNAKKSKSQMKRERKKKRDAMYKVKESEGGIVGA